MKELNKESTTESPSASSEAEVTWRDRVVRISLLSTREREVAGLVTEGLTDRQIAARLELGVTTVRTHLRGVLRKLQVEKRLQIVHMFLAAARYLSKEDPLPFGDKPGDKAIESFNLFDHFGEQQD